jgi:hypothetical protein
MRTSVTHALALTLGASALSFPFVHAGTFDECGVRSECRRVSTLELDRLRGGFTFANGGSPLHVSFGIAQAVVINNELIAVTQLTIPGLGTAIASFSPQSIDLTTLAAALKSANVTLPQGGVAPAGAVDASQTARPVVATSAGQTVAGTPAGALVERGGSASPAPVRATASAPAGAASTSLPAPSNVRVNGQSVTPGVPVLNVPTADELRGLVVQNGLGNIVLPSAAELSAGMTGTVIQNTLNNQTIRALTVINVSVAVQDALSVSRIQESVRQSIANSLR